MSRPRQTRVLCRTVEIGGPYRNGRQLCGVVKRAFASGKTVRFDGRDWRVTRFEPATVRGEGITWTALLVNEEPEL